MSRQTPGVMVLAAGLTDETRDLKDRDVSVFVIRLIKHLLSNSRLHFSPYV